MTNKTSLLIVVIGILECVVITLILKHAVGAVHGIFLHFGWSLSFLPFPQLAYDNGKSHHNDDQNNA